MLGPMPHRPSIARPAAVWLLPTVALLAIVAGCGGPAPPPAPPAARAATPTTPLRVAAASDLQAVAPVLASRFEQDTGVAVSFSFGSSGQLARQIEQGAPFDLFLAANRSFINDLVGRGALVPGSVRDYARGSLILVVHRAANPAVTGLADLTRPEVRKIAIANPDVAPYGIAGRQALQASGLWQTVGPKIVPAESVVQALQFVRSGNAEAGLVGRAIADVPEVRSIPLDPDLYQPLHQALGVTTQATRPADAEAFARFLTGPVGQGILADFGFRQPESASASGAGPANAPSP